MSCNNGSPFASVVDRLVHDHATRQWTTWSTAGTIADVGERTVGVLPRERKDLLLATAAREFATAGYEQASLNRIIRACGMSKSSFYHYVASKQALFDLVIAELGAELVEALDPPRGPELAERGFWQAVQQLVGRLLVLSTEDPRFGDLGRMFYLPGAPSAERSAVTRALAGFETWLDRALEAGREAGAVRSDLPASLQRALVLAVLRSLDEWSLRHQDELTGGRAEEVLAAQLAALRRLLAPDASADATGPAGSAQAGEADRAG